VQRHVFERGNLPAKITAGRVGEPAAEVAGGVAEAIRELCGAAVEQDARGLASACPENHRPRRRVLFPAGFAIDEMYSGGATFVIDRHLANHGVGDDIEVPGLERGWNEDGG
jgi:hypothetical protein